MRRHAPRPRFATCRRQDSESIGRFKPATIAVTFRQRFEGLWLSLRHWANDGRLTIYILVAGLEIKRELTVGHPASRPSAAPTIAAAIGGMAMCSPTLLPRALHAVIAQADSIIAAEALRQGPSVLAPRSFDAIRNQPE